MIMIVSSFSGSFFFFKQKTAYEMRISDWSSDVCSSDLVRAYRLPELETVQTLDQHRPEREAEDQRRQYPEHAAQGQIREGVEAGDVLSEKFREEIGRASCRERECQYV